jgi:hypothetical protein
MLAWQNARQLGTVIKTMQYNHTKKGIIELWPHMFRHVMLIIKIIPVPRVCLSTERLVALPVVVVILLEASSSDSKKLVVSRSELSIELDS